MVLVAVAWPVWQPGWNWAKDAQGPRADSLPLGCGAWSHNFSDRHHPPQPLPGTWRRFHNSLSMHHPSYMPNVSISVNSMSSARHDKGYPPSKMLQMTCSMNLCESCRIASQDAFQHHTLQRTDDKFYRKTFSQILSYWQLPGPVESYWILKCSSGRGNPSAPGKTLKTKKLRKELCCCCRILSTYPGCRSSQTYSGKRLDGRSQRSHSRSKPLDSYHILSQYIQKCPENWRCPRVPKLINTYILSYINTGFPFQLY